VRNSSSIDIFVLKGAGPAAVSGMRFVVVLKDLFSSFVCVGGLETNEQDGLKTDINLQNV